uniref:Mitochondrial assembly of ribosomal large subunit protein 1 n=1 Tax=Periophthalmus magnuspinnatus TaxID=409849 RepID=A0A3B4AD48_9GOBI
MSLSQYGNFLAVPKYHPNICPHLWRSQTLVRLHHAVLSAYNMKIITGSPRDFSLDVLVALLKQENALDLCVIKVPEQINYAHYLIVVSGYSTRHLKAMALYAIKVYKYLKKKHQPDVKIEGKDTEDWMCIDFGNMVVHFMLPESREVYELEKLWTLRSYDEQLRNMPVEKLPEDFIYDLEVTK